MLSSTKIAANISNQLLTFLKTNQKEINQLYDVFIRNVFLQSRFSIREWKRYVEILNDQIYKKGGLDNISLIDLSIIVYLYLFYPLDYQELTSNYDNSYEFNRSRGSTRFNDVSKDSYKFYIKEVLLPSHGYATFPRTFYENAKMYFLDDYVPNLFKNEADEILRDPEKLKGKLLEETMDLDFYYYVQNAQLNKDDDDPILNYIFSTIKSNPNIRIQLIQSILDVFRNKEETEEEKFRLFEEYTNKYYFTVEEKCHFYIKFGYANEYISKQLYQEIMVEIEQLNKNSNYKLEKFKMLFIGTSISIEECQLIINKLTRCLLKNELENLRAFLSDEVDRLIDSPPLTERQSETTIICFQILLSSFLGIVLLKDKKFCDKINQMQNDKAKELVNQLSEVVFLYRQSSVPIDGEEQNDECINLMEGIRILIVKSISN